jgi:hypothetical protein
LSGIARSGDGSDYDCWLSKDFRQDFADDGAIKSHGCAGLLVWHLEIRARRLSLTRVSQLDCSGQSHALVTGESAGQRLRSLTPRFSKHAVFKPQQGGERQTHRNRKEEENPLSTFEAQKMANSTDTS